MDYVSFNNMFTYTLVLIALAKLIVAIYANKKKEITAPRPKAAVYFFELIL